jgi:hypothetical protein
MLKEWLKLACVGCFAAVLSGKILLGPMRAVPMTTGRKLAACASP